MTKIPLTALIVVTLIAGVGTANAEGNIGAGKAKAGPCAGCHNSDGNSLVPDFPKLAQQHQGYLVKQLKDFKTGTRISPMMGPLASVLDDQTIEDVAAFFASNKITTNPPPMLQESDDDDDANIQTDEQKKRELENLLSQGSDLYRNGNLATAVSACIACHGPFGEGNKPAAFPALHSQHAEYLIKTLTDFKTGARSKNRENIMHMIAAKMTDQEIKAVAYYISTMK